MPNASGQFCSRVLPLFGSTGGTALEQCKSGAMMMLLAGERTPGMHHAARWVNVPPTGRVDLETTQMVRTQVKQVGYGTINRCAPQADIGP
jgi:hypothetical protein